MRASKTVNGVKDISTQYATEDIITILKQGSITYKAVTMTVIPASSSILMIRAFCLKTTTTKILY